MDIELPEAFCEIFEPEWGSVRYRVAAGGRGSSKSWSFCMMILMRCSLEKIRVLCVREFQNSIADSVYRLLIDQIYRMGLERQFTWTQSEIKSSTGSTINFRGLRDATGIRSVEKIDLVFAEESASISRSSWEILTPSVRAPGSEIWAVFNPQSEDDPTYQKFIVSPPKDAVVKMINYDQNPFFPDVLRAEMEHMKATDYPAYRHIWCGECRSMSEASVMGGKWEVKEFDDKDVSFFYLGLDFGWIDPIAITRCFIAPNDLGHECLWVDFEGGGSRVDIPAIPKLLDAIPRSRDYVIYADNARPEQISYLSRLGYPVRECEKWKGSVEDGVAHLRSFYKIYIHPRCKRTIYEFRNYQYKIDPRTNDVLPMFLDKNNHFIDALRYSLTRFIPRRGINQQYENIAKNFGGYGFTPSVNR